MNQSPPTRTTILLRQGIAAAKAGHSQEARRLLQQVVKTDPQNELGWLWLSSLMAAREQQQACLERVLLANPTNVYARAGLKQLQDPTPPPIVSSSNQAKPAIKRLKSSQHSSRLAADKIGMPGEVNSLEPSHSPAPTVPSPDLVADPGSLETTCPACEYPISLTDSQCPHCRMEFTPIEELLGRDLQKSPPAPTRPHRPHLRDILSLLGTIISSRTTP
jgi:tetratricopeptide (TPR) repeat protein